MARHQAPGVAKLASSRRRLPADPRPNFPYGLPKQAVLDIIQGTYTDRPSMLKNFGSMIFHNYVSPGISDWIFDLGLRASSWGTAAVANTWLDEEGLFRDLETIRVPTLILHGLDDKVCQYPLALAQKQAIRHARLVPFEACGHFLFYDQRERFNRELIKF
jgi:non-heme chloroperoxidase